MLRSPEGGLMARNSRMLFALAVTVAIAATAGSYRPLSKEASQDELGAEAHR